jgi:hypothetical protein
MATRNSDQAALQADPTLGNRAQGLKISGLLLIATSTYTMLGTEAAGDKINIVRLPMRAMVDPTYSTVVGDGIATTATLDVGDDDVLGVGAAADVDRYADGLDVAAAGIDKFDANACAARLTPYVLGSESWIIGTLVTLVTPVAGKKLVFRVGYIVVS